MSSSGDPTDLYSGREQTKAKHFILKGYLQALAFKVLRPFDMTYVDGFSGPWESKDEDFADSSFMIAINVLRDAQEKVSRQIGKKRRVRCFFSENDPSTFKKLQSAVMPLHNPAAGFEIQTFCGKFEDAIPSINEAIGSSFPLIFIDPTGWTGYPFEKIKSIFDYPNCEVIINFMFSHVSRFVSSPDAATIASLDLILGGPGWQYKLDDSLQKGLAVEKLFRETLQRVGKFQYVVSTKIDKATEDRPHFFLAYGTKNLAGLTTFRDIEYAALRAHARNRALAKGKKREEKSSNFDMFSEHEADVQEDAVDDVVEGHKARQAYICWVHCQNLFPWNSPMW